ncbi:hypothetical protein T492DRAFT_272496 [Pavlovales sp. CCMP2436]|nr:hypothetical protein T492DRAFT_272496 [Pavlovales sp. CCMP2436]
MTAGSGRRVHSAHLCHSPPSGAGTSSTASTNGAMWCLLIATTHAGTACSWPTTLVMALGVSHAERSLPRRAREQKAHAHGLELAERARRVPGHELVGSALARVGERAVGALHRRHACDFEQLRPEGVGHDAERMGGGAAHLDVRVDRERRRAQLGELGCPGVEPEPSGRDHLREGDEGPCAQRWRPLRGAAAQQHRRDEARVRAHRAADALHRLAHRLRDLERVRELAADRLLPRPLVLVVLLALRRADERSRLLQLLREVGKHARRGDLRSRHVGVDRLLVDERVGVGQLPLKLHQDEPNCPGGPPLRRRLTRARNG